MILTVPAPSNAVIAAFGATGTPVLLAGGKGGTWRVGDLAFKPVEFLPETRWRAEVLASLPESVDFRVPKPAKAATGDWAMEGWEASELVAGESDVDRQDEVLRAGIAFHAAIADLPRPSFLDTRDDPWSYGDRVAWEERAVQASPAAKALLTPLLEVRRPVELPSQVVHGDLPGNVLFADGLPPAVIDWPAYWRPTSWAYAVAVADALCWYGAGPPLVARWARLPEWGQMLVRALIYRIVTHDVASTWDTATSRAYRRAIDVVLA
ncbi:hypothetical protein HUW46_00365 [Amycolatopsis sp. CA-230715]|nr:hypothetical protein HUW46_00365 [Amycolatopsis sp. CA-230715]